MKSVWKLTAAALVLGAAMTSCMIPGVQGIDPATSTMTVDHGALKPEDRAYLEELGFKIREIDAVQETIEANIDATHEALKGLASATAPNESLEWGMYAILALLFGQAGVKGGKGLLGKLVGAARKKEDQNEARK